jgi:hypothetical protein
LLFCYSLRRNPPHRIEHPIRRINAIQILRHFPAQESPRHRMPWIALNLRGTAIFHGDQNAASIRAIVRTRGMDDLFHDSFDYKVLFARISEAGKRKRAARKAAR